MSSSNHAAASAQKKKTVFVIYYSTYGHILKLAKYVCRGLEKSGVNVKLFQVEETLPAEILAKIHAPPKAPEVPFIKPAQLVEADGIIFGMPTRFGMVPAQMKNFFDACGQLWMGGALANKYVGMFFSTAVLGGGQESTALSCVPFFAHMGMIYVPIGTKHKNLADNSQVRGGSAYGAGTLAGGDGARQPSKGELEVAEFQGWDFGNVVRRTY